MNNIIKLSLLITLSLSITSCSAKLKHKVGLTTAGPNEYSVTKNKTLEMPPHFNLEEIKKNERW